MRNIRVLFACAVLLGSREAAACAPAPHAGERVAVLEESAVIIWDPATKTQQFIRRATFGGEARDFGFLVPTPTAPTLAPVDDYIFERLRLRTTPETVYEKKTRIEWMPLLLVPFVGETRNAGEATTAGAPVEVLSTQKVAGYEAAILDASDAAALSKWLEDNGYATTADLTEWLEAYIAQKWIISAFKIDKSDTATPARTEAVKMTFTTERPFFPYREPASQREGAGESRLLRVWFIGPERVAGTIGAEKAWPAQLHWSDRIGELHGLDVPADARLSAFEDFSSPRPGTDDLFFARSVDQARIVPPPIVVTTVDLKHVPLDVVLAPVLAVVGFAFWRRRKNRH